MAGVHAVIVRADRFSQTLAVWGMVIVSGTITTARSQETPPPQLELEHIPAPCMDTDDYPLIEARAPSANVAHALSGLALRFRAETDTGWYETPVDGPTSDVTFRAALPKPLPDAARVRYYFVADERRSEEYVVPVLMGGCPGAQAADSELTNDIRVRRTTGAQSDIPTGFSEEGIHSGGSMSGTTLGVVSAGAGGAGVAALVFSGDEPPPENGGGVIPPNPEAIRACFTPDPIPDIDSGETILFDASCTTPSTVTTFQWDFGDGTTAEGSNVEHLFTPGGVYTVTLTATEGARSDSTSRVVQVIATPSACFITNPDPPRIGSDESINFNAECSNGDRDGGDAEITRYEWDFGDGRPGAEGVFVSRQFPEPDVYGVRLTVTNEDGRQDTNTQFVVVEEATTASTETNALRASYLTVTSALEFPDAGPHDPPRAQLTINDAESVTMTATQQLRVRGRRGENVVEGRLLSDGSEPGQWRLDFSRATGFVGGSLRVDAGQVLARDSHSVVLRLAGTPGSIIRIRFQVE